MDIALLIGIYIGKFVVSNFFNMRFLSPIFHLRPGRWDQTNTKPILYILEYVIEDIITEICSIQIKYGIYNTLHNTIKR